ISTFCPSCMRCAIVRDMMSNDPPAGNGTTMRTVFVGNSCASAHVAVMNCSVSAMPAAYRVIAFLLLSLASPFAELLSYMRAIRQLTGLVRMLYGARRLVDAPHV